MRRRDIYRIYVFAGLGLLLIAQAIIIPNVIGSSLTNILLALLIIMLCWFCIRHLTRLQGELRLLSCVVKSSPNIIMAFDQSLGIIYRNIQFENTFGDRALNMADIFDDESIAGLTGMYVKTAVKDGVWRGRLYMRNAKGGRVPVTIAFFPAKDECGNVLSTIAIASDISDRLRMEDELFEAQQTLIGVLENVPVSIYWKNTDLQYLGCNKMFETITGVTMDDIIGTTDTDFLPAHIAASTVEIERRLIEQREPIIGSEELFSSKNTGDLWVKANRCIVFDKKGETQYVLGVLDDVTEEKAAQKLIADALFKLEWIVKNYPGIIWCIDNDYNFTLSEGISLANEGVAPGELVGRSALDYYKDVPDLIAHLELTFKTGAQSFTSEINGVALVYNTRVLYDLNGDMAGMLGVASDITETLKLQRELEDAIKSAENASSAKSDFLSRMSHEIRTPMNAIIGMSKIGIAAKDSAKMQYCLEKIDNASDQLLNIINDILDMSKIEANKFEISNHEFDFEKMLLDVCNVITVKMEERGQSFTTDVDSYIPLRVISDDLRLSQVLINLLTNAIKFTPESGSIKLTIKQISRKDDICSLRFEVKDTGIGISAEQQKRLFTSFEQADGGIARKYGGTGLGLAICKKIISLMGGDIWVESEEGKGSTFIFELDIISCGIPAHSIEDGIDLTKMRALAIDDSEDIRIFFQNAMKNFSIRCDVAKDGEQALQLINEALSAGDPYTLIFVDWKMPGMNGVEVTRAIREIEEQNPIIIMMSVSDWAEMETEARDGGVDRFLPKPILSTTLLSSITEAMGISTTKEIVSLKGSKHHWGDRRLLLAEDVEINREIVITLLEETKICIDCVENGRLAVEAFVKAPNDYDLILMDVHMPEMDGLEATRQIRALDIPAAKTLSIIAMTANAFKEDIDSCISAGMNDHVSKPIDLDILIDKIDKSLRAKPPKAVPPIQAAGQELGQEDLMPYIDIDDAMTRLNKNRKLYKSLLKSFKGTELTNELLEHIENKDRDRALAAAHTIKGISANLSLPQINKEIICIETLLKSGHRVGHLTGPFQETVKSTIELTKRILES